MTEAGSTPDDASPAAEERPIRELPLPPGPGGLPVLGNALDVARDPPGFYEELATYGDVVGYRIPRMRFTTLLHPDHVERVLLTEHHRFGKWGFEEFSGDFASEGLLLTEGEQWRRQRTTIQNAFTLDRIEGYADAMARYAEDLLASWDDGETVVLNEALSRLTLRILTHSLFDIDLARSGDVVTRFTHAINDRADVSDPSAFLPMWLPTPGNRRYKQTLAEFRAFVDDLIEDRRGRADEYDDLLSLLLTAEDDDGERLSRFEVRDQMVTFLFAGHETTSLALTYLFKELAKRADVRERLDAEHDDVLGGGTPAPGDLGDLAYTGQVVDETLRLYPPAYMLFREAREDVAFEGYRVPAGTKVTLPQFRLHVDDRWYEEPETFRPKRWADDLRERIPDYAYFPFGGGPRHCIGMRFATMELKTVVPTVAQRVRFDLLTDPDPSFSATTLRPEADVRVRVRTR